MKTKYQHQIIEEELIRSRKDVKPFYYSYENTKTKTKDKLDRIRHLEIHLEIAKKSFEEGKKYKKQHPKTGDKK